MAPNSTTYLSNLHKRISRYFSLEEVRTLCLELNLDYDDLPGEGKAGHVRELVLFLAREGRLAEVVALAQRERPSQSWPPVPDDLALPQPIDAPGGIGSGQLTGSEQALAGTEISTEPWEPQTVLIPEGPFTMGSEPGEGVPVYETPPTEVTLPVYRIGVYPITNLEFAWFIEKSGQVAPPSVGWPGKQPAPDQERLPVAGVSWYTALDYCQWLTKTTGRRYMLPSEAQWEKAARGREGNIFPWGDEWHNSRYCNTDNNRITAVDAYPQAASPFGCYDMVGNVREWTTTLWGAKRRSPDAPFADPWQPDSRRDDTQANDQVRRVFRGGARRSSETRLRASLRGSQMPRQPGFPGARMGFRVVMVLED